MLNSTSFIFDDVPSEDYGLQIYFFEDQDQDLDFGTKSDIVETRIPKRLTPIHYGVNLNSSMSFPLTFGSLDPLDDYDVDSIIGWLTGHQEYKYLEFVDKDHLVRYKCIINNLKVVHVRGLPFAFKCDVECDSQFSYEPPQIYNYSVDGEKEIDFLNRSSNNGYIYPKVELKLANDCTLLSIINESDNDREFLFNNIIKKEVSTTTEEKNLDTTISEQMSDFSEQSILSWTESDLVEGGSNNKFNDILYGDGIYVALPYSGNKSFFSTNGVDWEETTMPENGDWIGCHGNFGFVAVSSVNSDVAARFDIVNKSWIKTTMPIIQNWNDITYGNGYYIAVGGVNSNIFGRSFNGLAWREEPVPIYNDWKGIACGDGRFVVVGGNGNIALYSDTGTVWYELDLPISQNWTGVAYGDNGFVIISDGINTTGNLNKSVILYSDNGLNWDKVDVKINSWNKIIYGSGKYFIISDGSKYFLISTNGKDWLTGAFPTLSYFSGICTDGDGEFKSITKSNDKLYSSQTATNVYGSFNIELPQSGEAEDEVFDLSNIAVSATLDNITSNTFTTVGTQDLGVFGLFEEEPDDTDEDDEQTGTSNDEEYDIPVAGDGDYVVLCINQTNKYDVSDTLLVKATYDEINRIVIIHYTVNVKYTELLEAGLHIDIQYNVDKDISLGLDGLVLNIDNENQIVTSNIDNFNAYDKFNFKFFRLIKGMNKIKFNSDGKCIVNITCEFLHKV